MIINIILGYCLLIDYCNGVNVIIVFLILLLEMINIPLGIFYVMPHYRGLCFNHFNNYYVHNITTTTTLELSWLLTTT